MTSSRPSATTVLRVLLVFSPFIVPALVVLAVFVVFFAAMIAQAFGEGFAVGCAALSALIGIPSVGLLWLSSALKLFGRKSIPSAPPVRPRFLSDIEARYAAGDFVHRDYEAERQERDRR